MKHALLLAACLLAAPAPGPTSDSIDLRGRAQQIVLYGSRGGRPVVLTSGDLGWWGLVVHVAEVLAARGYYVVGFNSRTYLTSFTSGNSALTRADVGHDYLQLAEYARRGSSTPPILAGVSEGAGLSVLAATFPDVKARIAGVLALGLPDQTALGWRWQDSTIWVTKKAPREPSFMVKEIIAGVSPVPLAEIHSSHDEFLSLGEARRMFALAGEPKKMWVIEAANHRFSNNRPELDRRLVEALEWIPRAK